MKSILCNSALVLFLAALTACGGGDESGEAIPDTEVVAEPAGGMEGMEGMQGGGMMEQMQAHMRMMEGAGGDSLMATMPMHRRMTANMIAQMNREMRDMNMTADAEWDETVDSLRQDLVRMPEMTAAELEVLMPEHRERVTRLMEMHRGMMGSMRM